MSARRALVTGANGGFGRRVLCRLLASGWQVDAVVRGGALRLRDEPALAAALDDGRLGAIDLDLDRYARAGEPRPLIDADQLHGLVNLAGTSTFGPVATLPIDEYRALHRLNVEAPYLLVQAHLPALVCGRGAIVNTSSLAAVAPAPFYGPYAATKCALEAWSESLSHEVGPLGVRVVCLQPSSYRTGVTARLRFSDCDEAVHPELARDLRRFRAFVTGPAARFARDPDEVALRVVDVLEGRRAGLRQAMGAGARLAGLAAWLPDRLRLALVGEVFRWQVRPISAPGVAVCSPP